jgi:CDP-paratose 2-epimerase
MKILITGVCGFVGSRLAEYLVNAFDGLHLIGIDNLSRRGSETNLPLLHKIGCNFIHGDIRSKDDITALPVVDWIIDCAANPSVLAGIEGGTSQLVGHNLIGTLNLLEKCRQDGCGLVLLSSSRVYSIQDLNTIPLQEEDTRFSPDTNGVFPTGFTGKGVSEDFSTTPPISLYGATKLASELMALEYAAAFNFPIWINRCGVIAGPGQFGKIDQGIFSFWMYQWLLDKPLSYIGFGGNGKQVRDFLSPQDLGRLVFMQLTQSKKDAPKVVNAGGGRECSMSLYELSHYCAERFGKHKEVKSMPENRAFDIPYYITDNTLVEATWGWLPEMQASTVLDSIAQWAENNRSVIESGF